MLGAQTNHSRITRTVGANPGLSGLAQLIRPVVLANPVRSGRPVQRPDSFLNPGTKDGAMAEKAHYRCTKCGHEWNGKAPGQRSTKPRCSDCDAYGGTIDVVDDDDAADGDDAADEPDEPQSTPDEPQSAPQPTPPAQNDQGGQDEVAHTRDRIAPPRPDEYGGGPKPNDDGFSVRDVFEDVIQMYPNYGDQVDPDAIVDYLTDMAGYYGTPTPDQLHDWLTRYRGVSSDTASDVEAQYDDALHHQLQQGNLDQEEVRSLFVPTGAQAGQSPPGGGGGSTSRSQTAAAVQGGGGQSGPAPQPSRYESKTKDSLMQSQSGNQVPSQVQDRLDRMDVSRELREAMREMYALGASEQDGSQGQPAPGDTREEQLANRIEMLEAGAGKIQGGGQEGYEFTDFLSQLTEVEQQLDQLRGGNSEGNQRLQRLEQRIEGLYEHLDRNQGGGGQDSGIAAIIANAQGMGAEDKAELLQAVEGASTDPEVKKEELRLQRHEAWAEGIASGIQQALGGLGGGGGDTLTEIRRLLRGPTRDEVVQPEPQPAPREEPARRAEPEPRGEPPGRGEPEPQGQPERQEAPAQFPGQERLERANGEDEPAPTAQDEPDGGPDDQAHPAHDHPNAEVPDDGQEPDVVLEDEA